MIHRGDALSVLRTMPAESVHCVVTSPPYWGLRDYGTAGQLGLEPTPEEYVARMVEVFREVRRVLRKDGTLWLNLGDSYAHSLRQSGSDHAGRLQNGNAGSIRQGFKPLPLGLKEKDLVGIPWRVAFALQADGWYLRSEIIWFKSNPMPESVTDRPTKAHEQLFLLSRSERYAYDADAIAEESIYKAGEGGHQRFGAPNGKAQVEYGQQVSGEIWQSKGRRNKRSVWEIATQPYPEAHFATYPEALVEPCIKAGCPKGGTVLDPFLGSGTTAVVAKRLGREYIGIELNPAYIGLAEKRIGLTTHEPELFEETA